MIQIAEIECDECNKLLAYVQIVPGTNFICGEALCPDCYEELGDSDV